MAKLTLVKARIISSKEDLTAFKKESTAALLNFAESNDCDLEAISRALSQKYAEIDQALAEGYKVETEVEIHPQPASPVQKTACMQKLSTVPGAPIHQALPVQQDEGNPEAQDPADLVAAQQERELAESKITMEDLAQLLAEAPDKQPIASDIIAAAPQIGQQAAFRLLAGLAYDRYTSKELLTIVTSLKILAAEEGEEPEAAPATEGDEGAVITHEPGKGKEQLSIEQHFSEGAFKAISDMVEQFNKLMHEVDPEVQLLPPITVEEIVNKMDVDKRRERTPVETDVAAVVGIDPNEISKYVLPSLNNLTPEEKVAALEGFDRADIDKAIDQWYGDNGLNPIDDMLTGVDQYLQANKVEGFTGKQILDQFLASQPEGHISYADINKVIGELRHMDKERADAEYKQLHPEEAGDTAVKAPPSAGGIEGDPEYKKWVEQHSNKPTIQSTTPEDFANIEDEAERAEKMEKYKVKVVDEKTGDVLGIYTDEASAKFDYPQLRG